MFRNTFSFVGALLLTGAAIVVTPGLARAQHGGGGHGGGGHGGGGHFGGGHFGGGFNHGGFNHGGFNHGGFNHGGFNHGGFNRGAFNRGAFNRGFNHRYRSFYGYPYFYGYGGYPYSDGYYPYSSDYGAYPYYGSYDDSYADYGYSGYPSYDNSSLYSAPVSGISPAVNSAAQADTTAHVTVKAPADAELWFDGTKTTSTGPVRDFQTPALASGHTYTYTIRAQWLENGKEVTQAQQVGVTAGADVRVDFPLPAATATPAPAGQGR